MEKNQQMHGNVRTAPRDFFLTLLSMVSLYWSAASFLTIVFQLINTWVPDPLDTYRHAVTQSLRFGISSLIIMFPVYMATVWYAAKDSSAHPEKRMLRVRRWLIYFTLFASALIIVGDLISLLNNFLSGELRIRFILKGLSILCIAGLVLGFYISAVRKDETYEKEVCI